MRIKIFVTETEFKIFILVTFKLLIGNIKLVLQPGCAELESRALLNYFKYKTIVNILHDW